jgi:hypothetical protein
MSIITKVTIISRDGNEVISIRTPGSGAIDCELSSQSPRRLARAAHQFLQPVWRATAARFRITGFAFLAAGAAEGAVIECLPGSQQLFPHRFLPFSQIAPHSFPFTFTQRVLRARGNH